ncbi:Thiol-disulfide isomerase or thioredoxin [Sphingobacterium nematocida]|uniref:Thiol-disulfide isomerase or thioredoxin n=1 Tax=Sphingobacterium nematocida TaxID=1513896 RepID=A0A1T5AUK8_9SPHI|nr:TlpA disulfide reductase family protein [Sphingobacterium nematocida]SKB38741.1 Thiol-disulfide isomerase or thioredoxin [Sphingobacterium nematocida]
MKFKKFSHMRTICVLLSFYMPVLVYAQEPNFTLTGKFKNWPNGRVLRISYMDENTVKVDSVVVKGGRFQYKNRITAPTEVTLSYDPPAGGGKKDNCKVFIKEGTVSLLHTDSLRLAKVSGPLVTMEYEVLKENIDPLREKLIALMLAVRDIRQKGGSQVDYQEMDKEYKHTNAEIISRLKKFILDHPRSFISLLTIQQLDGSKYANPEIFTLFQGLDKKLRESKEGLIIAEKYRIGMKIAPGKELENFSSLDTNRLPLSLAEVKAKGKVTLVDFWASWCGPCRAENPHLRKVYADFHDKGFNILAVSLDRNELAWKKAINQDQLPWYHISSLQYWDEPIVKQFGITGVPDSFLLDAEGRIIGRGLRGDKLYEAVKKALND